MKLLLVCTVRTVLAEIRLSDLITFGKRAGEFASKRAEDLAQPNIDDAQVQSRNQSNDLHLFNREEGENPGAYL